MSNKLIGTSPNQVPSNADLGTLAYQDADNVNLSTLLVAGSDVGPVSIHSTNTNGSYIKLSNVDTDASPDVVWIGAQGNDTKFYQSNTLLSMIILESGNVGIGTASPQSKLEVATSANPNNYSDGAIQVVSSSPIAFVAPSNLNPSLNRWGFTLREGGEGHFGIRDYRHSNTRVTIDDSGNVGIGTNTPDGLLDVRGTESQRLILANQTAAPTNGESLPPTLEFHGRGWNTNQGNRFIKAKVAYVADYGDYGAGATQGSLRFSLRGAGGSGNSPNTEQIGMTLAGGTDSVPYPRLGIGTTTPAAALHVYIPPIAAGTDLQGQGIVVSTPFTSGYQSQSSSLLSGYDGALHGTSIGMVYENPGYALTFFTNNNTTGLPSERMRITDDGLVGIGEDNPQGMLHVTSTRTSGGDLWTQIGPGNATSINIQNDGNASNTNAAIFFRNSVGEKASIGARFIDQSTGETQLRFGLTNSSGASYERIFFDGDGNIGLGTGTVKAKIHINQVLDRYIEKTIDYRNVGDGVYEGYILLAKYHSNPGTNAHPAHKLFGHFRADRGSTGAGNSHARAYVSASTAWTDSILYARIDAGNTSGYFSKTVKLTYDGADYMAIKFNSTGGGPQNGIYFDGHVHGEDANILTMKRDTEVSNVTDFGNYTKTNLNTGNTTIGGVNRSSKRTEKLGVHGSGIGYGYGVNNGGQRSTLGFYEWPGAGSSTIQYVHIKTSLWAGGSGTSIDGFSGNSQYAMMFFKFKGYKYSPASTAEGQLGFHNWNGSILSKATIGYPSSWNDLANNAYKSADGYVVLVAYIGGSYGGFTVDMHQPYDSYPTRDIRVLQVSTHNTSTGAF